MTPRVDKTCVTCGELKKIELRRRKCGRCMSRLRTLRVASDPERRARRLSQKRAEYQRHRVARIAHMKQYRLENLEKRREADKWFGPIHRQWYAHVLLDQRGGCAFCGNPHGTKIGRWGKSLPNRLATDHDHKFAKRDPRGWRRLLCNRCNMVYGYMRENANFILAMYQAALMDVDRFGPALPAN